MAISSKRIFQGDIVIWIIFFLLCLISLIEVYSAAATLTYKSQNYMAPLLQQAKFLAGGTLVAWFFHSIPWRFYKTMALAGLLLSGLLLVVTLFFGSSENESTRWIDIGFKFQPSELAKGALVLYTAFILSLGRTEQGANEQAFSWIVWPAVVICGLIFPENFSTAVLLFSTIVAMLFIGRVPMKSLLRLGLAIVAFFFVFFFAALVLPRDTVKNISILHRMDTWAERISSPTKDGKEMNDTIYLRDHAQEAHARIAIATSNGIGKMPGNSEQRDHLSQAFSDFIYAIIIEEMGIAGGVLVVALYIFLLIRTGRIASRCERNFPAYLAMGFAILMVAQAMMNVLVAVGLAPVTGQPLPLISRGGTSTIINCAYFGIILSVSRYVNQNAENKKAKSLPHTEEVKDETVQEEKEA